MTEKLWLFEALDTWFFRDSTPFTMGESDSRGIKSMFPPGMFTLQGAIRTALAAGMGWSKDDKWPEEILGTHDTLGALKLQGPYLAIDTEGKTEFLFPFPASVARSKETFVFLVPGGTSYETDIMPATLLTAELKGEKVQSTSSLWLKAAGAEKVLSGQLPAPETWFSSVDLWSDENRIGIKLDRKSGTVVQEGGLYALTHIRPSPRLRLAVIVSGVDEALHSTASRTIPLGGESRMAKINIHKSGPFLPKMPVLEAKDGIVRFTITLITPALFGGTDENAANSYSPRESVVQALRKGPLEGIGHCVSACIPKLSQLGGWDIVNRQPRPLHPLVMPGATWFHEIDAGRQGEISPLHGCKVGLKTEYGFGQILVGRWG